MQPRFKTVVRLVVVWRWIWVVGVLAVVLFEGGRSDAADVPQQPPDHALDFLYDHCIGCHDAANQAGGLDIEALPSISTTRDLRAMGSAPRPGPRRRDAPARRAAGRHERIKAFLRSIAEPMAEADRRRAEEGRSTLRRLNRSEQENRLRDLLAAPWLQVADMLPEDGNGPPLQQGRPGPRRLTRPAPRDDGGRRVRPARGAGQRPSAVDVPSLLHPAGRWLHPDHAVPGREPQPRADHDPADRHTAQPEVIAGTTPR